MGILPLDTQKGCGLSCAVQSLLSEPSHLIGQHSAGQLRPLAWLYHPLPHATEKCPITIRDPFLKTFFWDTLYLCMIMTQLTRTTLHLVFGAVHHLVVGPVAVAWAVSGHLGTWHTTWAWAWQPAQFRTFGYCAGSDTILNLQFWIICGTHNNTKWLITS